MRNTVLQFLTQVATAAFTSGLTLFLVRKLGASGYGIYSLAYSIGGLALLPAGLGLPTAVGRFLADHRSDVGQMRAILALGLKLQVPAALVSGAGLFALAGAIADAYGHPALGWPLRWMGCAVVAQAIFGLFTSTCMSIRRISGSLWMVVIESAIETFAAVALVLAGAGAAGALLGKAIGYAVAAVAGFVLVSRLLGGMRRRGVLPSAVHTRSIVSYAGVLFVVNATWQAIAQMDILLIGALLSSAAVGSFGAVLKILTLLGYLGIAVSGGVAPRLSLGGGAPDTRTFNAALRYLLIVQGLVIAPMLVWPKPIVGLLLGHGYSSSPAILRVLTVQAFVSAPASLASVSVSYLGEGRRRVMIMLATLALGIVSTYVLLRVMGLLGAAVADDLVQVVYVSAHLWLCSRLFAVEFALLTRSLLRTLLAAAAMTVPMLAMGVDHLSVLDWVVGGAGGLAAYLATLLLSREISLAELRHLAARIRLASVPR
ncbi:MAG: oligosaccharide flippase family protein [Solirubrobacterales bacterium]|nr:oligosaccharide flippase family protein [Solirubrobacterales bacterium]